MSQHSPICTHYAFYALCLNKTAIAMLMRSFICAYCSLRSFTVWIEIFVWMYASSVIKQTRLSSLKVAAVQKLVEK